MMRTGGDHELKEEFKHSELKFQNTICGALSDEEGSNEDDEP